MSAETIPCPKHGDRPAVPAIDAPLFTQCRTCWYREWVTACLTWSRRHR